MKTEVAELNQESLMRKLGDECFFKMKEINPSGGIREFIRIAVEFGYKKSQSSPKIKQLEWERNGPICYVNQYNPIGYTAAITKWGFGENQYSVRLGLNDSNSSVKIFNSLDEAKDFVQQDFERRIKECLITE